MSLEGTRWRMAYESETEDSQVGLDSTVWPRVFEKYEQFLKDVHFQPGDEELQFTPVTQGFREGKTAMVRNTAALAEHHKGGRYQLRHAALFRGDLCG